MERCNKSGGVIGTECTAGGGIEATTAAVGVTIKDEIPFQVQVDIAKSGETVDDDGGSDYDYDQADELHYNLQQEEIILGNTDREHLPLTIPSTFAPELRLSSQSFTPEFGDDNHDNFKSEVHEKGKMQVDDLNDIDILTSHAPPSPPGEGDEFAEDMNKRNIGFNSHNNSTDGKTSQSEEEEAGK